MIRRSIQLALVAAVATAIVPAPASAQLKKLGKAIGSTLGKKKIDQAVSGDSSAATQEPAAASGEASASLEITPERLDQFLVALAPVMNRAKTQSEYRQKQAGYEQRSKDFESCRVKIMSDPSNYVSVPDDHPEKVKLDKRLDAASAALDREIAKGPGKQDNAEVERINKEMMDIAYRQQLLSMPAIKTCGEPPVAPAALSASNESSSETAIAPQARASFTRTQFGQFRERVGAWILTQGKGDTRMVFTASEQDAMRARAEEIALLEPYFRDGSIQWAHWGDLPDDWK